MVATVLRLKARILRHTLRREGWRVVILVFGILWALSMVPSVLFGMRWLSFEPVTAATDVLVVGGALLLLGWILIPVLIPAMDDSLDIGRFGPLGLRARALVPGLMAASVLSVPTVFTAFICLAPVAMWARHGAGPGLVAVVAGVLGLLTCVVAAHLSTEISARVLASRRSREIGAVVGLFAALLLVPAVAVLGSLGLGRTLERLPAVADVLSWTPFGLVWAAPGAAARAEVGGAVVRLLLAALWVGIGIRGWTALLQRALTSPPSRGGQVRRRLDGMLPRRSGRLGATSAIARRGLRYWTSDPRYLGSLLGALVAPALIVVLAAAVADAPAVVALSLGAAMGGTLGWGRHNDVAFDGTAFWLHVAARVPGWADRLGRTVATALWALPLVVVASLAGAALSGRWDLAPAAVGAGVGVLCGGLAVSAVVSASLPYPVPQAGANPFAAQMGAVGASLLAQLVSMVATLALCAPVLAAYGAALWAGVSPWVVLVVGGVVGPGMLASAIFLGGRLYDARAPRLLARLS